MRIYCDHAATTPLCDEARTAMAPFQADDGFGNPSEPHWWGRRAAAALKDARHRCGSSLGCRGVDLIFTGGGSEADNLAVLGRTLGRRPGRAVASSIEHPAVRGPLQALEAEGWEIVWIDPGPSGAVDPAAFDEAVRPGDALCCVIWASNVTGVIQPVGEIAAICAERRVPLHLDAVQACAYLDVGLCSLPGQVTLAAAAHKLRGPKGVGLLAGNGLPSLAPVLHGGGQELGLRPGTEDVPGAVALAASLERARAGAHREPIRSLRDRFEHELSRALEGVRFVGSDAHRLPGHSLALIEGVRGDTLVVLLDRAGVACAAGSACASGSGRPSYALTAMGLPDDVAHGALRLTWGELNEPAHVGVVVDAIVESAGRLRAAAAAVA